eukprot:1051708-Prorocentrum_minimum.AAC.5
MGPFSGLQQTVKGTYTDVCCTKRVYQVQTCRVSNAAGHCLSNTSYIPTSCVLHPPVFYILTLRPSRAVATHELRRGRGVALAAEDTTQSSGAEAHANHTRIARESHANHTRIITHESPARHPRSTLPALSQGRAGRAADGDPQGEDPVGHEGALQGGAQVAGAQAAHRAQGAGVRPLIALDTGTWRS